MFNCPKSIFVIIFVKISSDLTCSDVQMLSRPVFGWKFAVAKCPNVKLVSNKLQTVSRQNSLGKVSFKENG